MVFLTGVALPGIFGNSRETNNRIKCASNLRQLSQAMLLYANENNGNYPRTTWNMDSEKLKFYSKPDAVNPLAKGADGVDAADVTAAMFLLVRTQDITTEVFICPSGDAEALTGKDKNGKDRDYDVQKHSNFPDAKHLGYSMQVPYPSKAAVLDGFRWTNTIGKDFALFADMNPGTEELTKLTANSPEKDIRKGNSTNHAGNGQNVVYGDGHVEFQRLAVRRNGHGQHLHLRGQRQGQGRRRDRRPPDRHAGQHPAAGGEIAESSQAVGGAGAAGDCTDADAQRHRISQI